MSDKNFSKLWRGFSYFLNPRTYQDKQECQEILNDKSRWRSIIDVRGVSRFMTPMEVLICERGEEKRPQYLCNYTDPY